MIDLDAVSERHDAAVLIERKIETDDLDFEDLEKLFACISDIPDLLAYIHRLEGVFFTGEVNTSDE